MLKAVIVCGSRKWTDKEQIRTLIKALPFDCVVIEGRAQGADLIAEEICDELHHPFEPFPADWDNISRPGAVVRKNRFGKPYDAAAGPFRNRQMLDRLLKDAPNIRVFAFHEDFDRSKGTKDMVKIAMKAKVPCTVIDLSADDEPREIPLDTL